MSKKPNVNLCIVILKLIDITRFLKAALCPLGKENTRNKSSKVITVGLLIKPSHVNMCEIVTTRNEYPVVFLKSP